MAEVDTSYREEAQAEYSGAQEHQPSLHEDEAGGATAAASEGRRLTPEDQLRSTWGPVLLLGPILPAFFAITIILVGSIILHGNPIDDDALETCGYPLDDFLSAAIATSFLFLLVFSWSFLGFDASFTIKGRKWVFLRPFRSLKLLAVVYSLVWLMSLVVWSIGSWAVAQGGQDAQCEILNGPLLHFTSFLVIAYWIGVCYATVTLAYLAATGAAGDVKLPGALQGGGVRAAGLMKQLKGKSQEEAEETALRNKFRSMKGGPSGVIGHEALQTLLTELGINLSGKDLQSACEEMDPDGEGEIFVDDFIKWWKGRGGEEDSQWDGANDDDGDDDND